MSRFSCRHGHRLLSTLLLPLLTMGCQESPETRPALEVHAPEALARQGREFEKGVEAVAPGIWMAIGHGLANSILIEGPEGLVVIDTMATLEEGREVASAFRAFSDKPLRAIVYTHNHADHVFGAQAFIDVLGKPGVTVDVFAHETLEYYVNRVVSEFRPILTARSFRMFGTLLDEAGLVNNGLGPALAIDAQSTFGFVRPTRTFRDRLEVTVAGMPMVLQHAPGETSDALFAWFPGQRALASGDNLYKAFPNLYTIRGTPYRSPRQWADAIDRMRELPAEILLPSHTRPLVGRAEIHEVLTTYRDGIRYVYDQSVRWINAGLTPDEIATRVRLPAHLARAPYLQEFYGKAEWSARSVFAGNLGWFDGNPTHLHPFPPKEYARRVADLAGGQTALKDHLDIALQEGDMQWALQLSDWLLRLDPDDAAVRRARVDALTRLGEIESNPNARHYYLMSALELRDGVRLRPLNRGSDRMVRALPMEIIMNALATNLRAEDTLDMNRRVGIRFTDTGEQWTLWVRRGVLEAVPRLLDELEIELEVDSLAWKKMLGRQVSPALTIARDMKFHQGGAVAFTRFMLLFRPLREAPEPAPLAAVTE